MIVVDATVMGDLFLGRPEQRKAVERLLHKDSDWISLPLLEWELGNVCWKAWKFGSLELRECQGFLADLGHFVKIERLELDLEAILGIAAEKKLTFYDASYVWFAVCRGLLLYTQDREILVQCPGVARNYFP